MIWKKNKKKWVLYVQLLILWSMHEHAASNYLDGLEGLGANVVLQSENSRQACLEPHNQWEKSHCTTVCIVWNIFSTWIITFNEYHCHKWGKYFKKKCYIVVVDFDITNNFCKLPIPKPIDSISSTPNPLKNNITTQPFT